MTTAKSVRYGIHVSLPCNDPALAQAAANIGAVGLKTHIDVKHRASGTSFGSLEVEELAIQAIMDVGLPTGLVVGSGSRVRSDVIRRASTMGFAYFDLYASEMPSSYVLDCGPTLPIVALGPQQTELDAARLAAAGIAAFELSTLPPALYGSPLSDDTMDRIRAFRSAVDRPLIVPSQHRLVPSDIPRLLDAGATAILLGAVVFGRSEDSMADLLPDFIEAVKTGSQ